MEQKCDTTNQAPEEWSCPSLFHIFLRKCNGGLTSYLPRTMCPIYDAFPLTSKWQARYLPNQREVSSCFDISNMSCQRTRFVFSPYISISKKTVRCMFFLRGAQRNVGSVPEKCNSPHGWCIDCLCTLNTIWEECSARPNPCLCGTLAENKKETVSTNINKKSVQIYK